MTIRAVLFDLYDTLIHADESGTPPAALAFLASAGVNAADWESAWAGTLRASMRGEATLRQRVRTALEQAGADGSGSDLADELAALMHARNAPTVYSDVRPALAELRQRGYCLALVSNIASYRVNWLPEFELDCCFDVLALSCELGAAKPEARIYLHAAERLAVAPEECIFVGDGMSKELSGARAVGMTTVRIDRSVRELDDPRDEVFDFRVTTLDELLAWLSARNDAAPEGASPPGANI